MKKILALLLVLMLVLPVAASAENVLRIGVFQPVTGQNGAGGFQEVLGTRYAHSLTPTVEIGGVTYEIELVEVDNQSERAAAVIAAQTLMASNVSVVVGSYGSAVCIAAGETFEEAGVAAIGASCTNPQVTLGNEFYFRICFLDPFQGEVMANFAFQEGARKAAIITELGDDYSSALGNFFKNAFEKLGGEVVEEQFQTGQTDFRAVLTNIKAAEVDAIFAPSSIATAPLIIKQARELGIEAPIMAGDTWENVTIIENAGADAEGVTLSTFFDEADPTAAEFVTGFKAFLNATPEYFERNGGDGVAAVSALGFDAYNVAIAAIQAAGSTDSRVIRDALVDVSITGVTGDIAFDVNGDAIKNMAFIKVVEDGAFKFLKTVTTE
ncbi:MAG: ABC transporter substrate-binding protein [Clostridia bacterium]|nr:ABC transporter substrate-binding protein [Clostridia bacterium]